MSAVASTSRRVARVNRRTARSSQQHAAAALAELYHLAPTFVPAHHPRALHRRVTETLTPIAYEGARPRPTDFRDLVNLNRHLDLERVRLTAARTVTSSLQSVNVTVPANYDSHHDSFFGFGGPTSASQFDYRGLFYRAYSQAGDPPLANRLRRVVDALHGTTEAVEWTRQLERAHGDAREQQRRDEDESRAFQAMFEDDQPPRTA